MRRLLAVFVLSPATAIACSSIDLHVAAGMTMPPSFSTTSGIAFPHVRTTLTPDEVYRAGDVMGGDGLTLFAVKGPGAGEVTLTVSPAAGCPPLVTFADGATFLRDLHVATTGSPGGDGSPTNPFDTIQRAANVATPGDRIVVHAGNYPGSNYITNLQGTAAQPIMITGAPSEPQPILGSTGVSEALHLTDPAYLILQDFIVDGPTGNGINIDDGGDFVVPAHHVLLRNVTIRNVGSGGNQDCLKLSGLDDFFVLDSLFERCSAGGSNIDMVGCHQGLIARNQFRNGGSNGVQGKGGTSDILIHGNLMVNAGPRALNLGGSTGFAFFRPPLPHPGGSYEARNLRAIANVIIGSDAPVAFVGCDGCLVANNTIYLPTRWVMRVLQETTDPSFLPCRDGRFINNVVVFDLASISTFVNIGPNTQWDTFTLANNLWFARDSPGFPGPNLPAPVVESNPIIQRDPLLADPAGEDFHLGGATPARAAGVCVAEVKDDRDRVCYGDPPTVGAYEAP